MSYIHFIVHVIQWFMWALSVFDQYGRTRILPARETMFFSWRGSDKIRVGILIEGGGTQGTCSPTTHPLKHPVPLTTSPPFSSLIPIQSDFNCQAPQQKHPKPKAPNVYISAFWHLRKFTDDGGLATHYVFRICFDWCGRQSVGFLLHLFVWDIGTSMTSGGSDYI